MNVNTATQTESGLRVLVVDDDTLIAGLLKEIIGRLGCTVDLLHNGRDVLNGLSIFAPDVIFLDLIMPGLDGIEVLGILGEAKCTARIVLMSGMDKRTLSSASAVAQSHNLEVIGAVTKPFTVKGIEEILKPLLETITNDRPAKTSKDQFSAVGLQLQLEPQLILGDVPIETLNWVNAELVWQTDDGEPLDFEAVLSEQIKRRSARALINSLLREVAAARNQWALNGLDLGVGLRLSNEILKEITLPDILSQAVTHYEFDPATVMFEINDTAILDTNVKIYDLLSRLKIKGFRLALSVRKHSDQVLSMLNKLAIDELVIDISYGVRRDHTLDDSEAEFQISSLVSVAQKSGVLTTAMNLVNAPQLEFAKRCKISRVRGPFIQEPSPAARILEFYKN